MSEARPTVGRVVHYLSHGTPVRSDGSQEYPAECRAAIVTEVGEVAPFPGTTIPSDAHAVSLCVLNPTGLFFRPDVQQDETACKGGTWHWPERA